MSSPHPIRLLSLLALVSSCDMTEDQRIFPPHPATVPFTCESADQFIRTADESFGHVFFIDDPTEVFYSFSDNRISKYGLPDLQVRKSKSLSLGETIYYSCERDERSAWLFTATISGNLAAYVIDTALNVTHRSDIHSSSLGIISGATDGGFVMATHLYELGNDNYSVLRYSGTGTLMWRQDPAAGNLRTMIVLKDGGFLIGGSTDAAAGSYHYNFLTKLSDAGKALWTRSAALANINNGSSVENVIEDDSGDYFLLLGNGGATSLVRADSAFNIRWSIPLDGQYAGNLSTLSRSDDRILVLSFQFDGTSNDIYFEGYTRDGEFKWKNQYGGTGDEHASAVSNIQSGYYLIGGTNNYPEPGYLGVEKGYLIKTDLEGRSCQ